VEKNGLRSEYPAAREEAAIVDVVDDLTGALGEIKLKGDGEGQILPRPIPPGVTGKDLVSAEKPPSPLVKTPSIKSIKPGEGWGKAFGFGKKGVELDKENVRLYGKKKARKIAEGNLVMEDGKGYDMSLVWAMYESTWIMWWKAVILSACGGEFE